MKYVGIYCIGRNYLSHINELKNDLPTEPVVFLKAPSALRVLSAEKDGLFPYPTESFDHELEIVLEISETVKLNEKPTWKSIRGIRLGLDLTRRQKQTELKSKSLPWTLAKSFRGAAVVSDLIATHQVKNIDSIRFDLHVNKELRQSGDSKLMMWQPLDLISFIAQSHELVPGDLIFTGTPAGVGPLRYGDNFEMRLLNEELTFSGVL